MLVICIIKVPHAKDQRKLKQEIRGQRGEKRRHHPWEPNTPGSDKQRQLKLSGLVQRWGPCTAQGLRAPRRCRKPAGRRPTVIWTKIRAGRGAMKRSDRHCDCGMRYFEVSSKDGLPRRGCDLKADLAMLLPRRSPPYRRRSWVLRSDAGWLAPV